MTRRPLPTLCLSLLLPLTALAPALIPAAIFAAPTTQSSTQTDRHEALEKLKAALKQLDLTDTQKEKIKSIVSDAKTKLKALKGDKTDTSQRREILQQTRKDILAVLTQPQKIKLRQILKNDKSESST